jgi:hypothetical protein
MDSPDARHETTDQKVVPVAIVCTLVDEPGVGAVRGAERLASRDPRQAGRSHTLACLRPGSRITA